MRQVDSRKIIFDNRSWLIIIGALLEGIGIILLRELPLLEFLISLLFILTLGSFNHFYIQQLDDTEIGRLRSAVIPLVMFVLSSATLSLGISVLRDAFPSVGITPENHVLFVLAGTVTTGLAFYTWPFIKRREVVREQRVESRKTDIRARIRDLKDSISKIQAPNFQGTLPAPSPTQITNELLQLVDQFEMYLETEDDEQKLKAIRLTPIAFLFGENISPLMYAIISLAIEYFIIKPSV